MNAASLKRLYRAIGESQDLDVRQVATQLIEQERNAGHSRLAHQLEMTLSTSTPRPSASKQSGTAPRLIELPTSRRHNEPLATLMGRTALEHHMVLRPDIETRFTTIEREYAARTRLAHYGLSPRRRILLYGPPGCGKTLGAQRLAWNTGLPLMKVRFDSIVSSYLGESAANLRSVVECSKSSPCLLLLDECDYIARSRTGGQDVGEVPRIVNTLLQLLDEYDAPGLLVATTNLEGSLDKALFRRFDDVLEVPQPEIEQIIDLLRMTLSAIRVEPKVDLDRMARLLEGKSAASVVTVAKNAAKLCVLENSAAVTQEQLERAARESRDFT